MAGGLTNFAVLAAAARAVCNEEMFGDNTAKRAAANDDGVKGARSPTDNLPSAVERLRGRSRSTSKATRVSCGTTSLSTCGV